MPDRKKYLPPAMLNPLGVHPGSEVLDPSLARLVYAYDVQSVALLTVSVSNTASKPVISRTGKNIPM